MPPATNEDTPGPSGYDAELQRHQVLRACDVQPHDHVLDIGCGTGQTTRQAARTAKAGSARGVVVHEPVYYGPDVTAALDWVRGFACTNEVLKRLDPAAAARALGRLREALSAHQSDAGVWFNSRIRPPAHCPPWDDAPAEAQRRAVTSISHVVLVCRLGFDSGN